jgi:hypothetical protein
MPATLKIGDQIGWRLQPLETSRKYAAPSTKTAAETPIGRFATAWTAALFGSKSVRRTTASRTFPATVCITDSGSARNRPGS